MPDITMLKLADHEWFREQFAQRDNLQARASVRKDALEKVWRPLADKLDVHAYIEEKIFYPQLLTRGVDDPTAKRSMRSAITTTSVTVFRTPMRRRLALTSGGRRSRERVRRMTSTWARRNAKDYQTFHPHRAQQGLHSYYEPVRQRIPRRYSLPCGSAAWQAPSRHPPLRERQCRDTPSHVPCKRSRPDSRRLYAGHHLASQRSPARLIPGCPTATRF